MIEIREDKEGKAYKQLKAVSRQPLINFVNLKSNTIMKKPQRKYIDFYMKPIVCIYKKY